jgi:putative toxin-antitoxin system antitoxin component (TIGR02293 family)
MAVAYKPDSGIPAAAPSKARLLFGSSFGIMRMDVQALIHAAHHGVSWDSVKKFMETAGLTQQQLASYLDLPERTFARRRTEGAFDSRESEKILRLVEICEDALELFDGNRAAAASWLLTPAFGLGNASPIDYARTEFGAREVRALIGRIADGVFS